jgi:hypothetical protein
MCLPTGEFAGREKAFAESASSMNTAEPVHQMDKRIFGHNITTERTQTVKPGNLPISARGPSRKIEKGAYLISLNINVA